MFVTFFFNFSRERQAGGNKASIGFLHIDLVGTRYICYLQPDLSRLTLVQLTSTEIAVVKHATLRAYDAIPLEHLHVIVVLDPSGRLMMYSGTYLVGKVHIAGLPTQTFLPFTGYLSSGTSSSASSLSNTNSSSSAGSSTSIRLGSAVRRSSLLPNVSPCDIKFEEELHKLSPVRSVVTAGSSETTVHPGVALLDGTGTRFTIAFDGGVTSTSGKGRSYRVTLPSITDSQLVRRCLTALIHVLPKETAHDFSIRWYGKRNVPGTHAGFTVRQEWTMFQALLLSAMGRPVTADADNDNQERPTTSCIPNPSFVSFLKKRRKRENSQGREVDWEFLRDSMVQEEQPPIALKEGVVRKYKLRNDPHCLYQHIPDVMMVLHLLYEDLKLYTGLKNELRLLGELLFILATDAQVFNYQQHYFLDNPALCDLYRNATKIEDQAVIERIKLDSKCLPHIFRYLSAVIERKPELNGLQKAPWQCLPYPHIDGINDRCRDVVLLAALMVRDDRLTTWVTDQLETVLNSELLQKQLEKSLLMAPSPLQPGMCDYFGTVVLQFLIQRGYTRRILHDLPVAVHFILQNMIEPLRFKALHGHDADVYSLLLRPDLNEHEVSAGAVSSGPLLDSLKGRINDRLLSEELQVQWFNDMTDIEALTGVLNIKEDPLMMERQDGMDKLDVELLRLRFPYDQRIHNVRDFLNSSSRVLIDITQNPTVSDHDFIDEQERCLYVLCQRTMALPIARGMFTFSTHYQTVSELSHIPRLCLTGREPVRGATIELVQFDVPSNMSLWPSFHNGVAAGLRISPDSLFLTSNWIANNRTACKSNHPPGSYLPLLGSESMVEHGGFLLALGLTGHLRMLSRYNIFDYLVRSHELMRIGVLLGLSAAHRGTENEKITRVLAVHVEALLPPTAIELDVTNTVQVAALFGIGLLYQGTAKRHIAAVLLQEIGRPPGPEMDNAVERESYALTAGLALGMVTLGCGEQLNGLRDLSIPGELYHYMNGGTHRMVAGAQREKYKMPSFQICEGDSVNQDVTAPGATLALGLMFFGTNEPTISNWLVSPDNKYQLGLVRPDLLLLRVIARHLISWDQVQSTKQWVTAQLPEILVLTITSIEANVDENPAETSSMHPQATRLEHVLHSQAYCAIVCGSAVAIGLRFAGTADSVAVDTLHHYMRYFISLRHPKKANTDIRARNLAKIVGYQVLENCVLMTLLSLSLVLAGTGDVRVLRTVRFLRSRCGIQGVTYGSHMAVHMALGFVFLGGGRYTLSRSPPAIAAILCAIFPKFPVLPNDNRYHLQALRHMYVLAVEPRLFVPRRIGLGILTRCRIRFCRRDLPPCIGDGIESRMAPCMLPELHTLLWLEVSDESFYPIRFSAENWKMLE